ncbi:MAG: FHA domain-containing protein [Acidimicrobiia bacterium]|nr:FHA domain-containing protein [Acidimicrobiia bacterium]
MGIEESRFTSPKDWRAIPAEEFDPYIDPIDLDLATLGDPALDLPGLSSLVPQLPSASQSSFSESPELDLGELTILPDLEIVLDDGRRIGISGRVVVGREPGGPGGDLDGATGVIVDDATVSRSHLEIEGERGSAKVRDLGSTNGSEVELQDSAVELGGEFVRLPIGARVVFGERSLVLGFRVPDHTGTIGGSV